MIRYIVLLMGFFATFNGIIYNDFMAIPIWLFKSCYHVVEDTSKHYVQDPKHHHEIPMKLTIVEDCVYPIGVDPAWYLGSNELTFLNSLKMKISVILGVLQMSLGVLMKGLNAIYFRNYLDFIFEFIPQIILLLVLFGYMDWLIIAKWLTNFTHVESRAPSVISTMIGVFLDFGKIPPGQVGVIGSDSTQTALSIFCLVVALICVPTMLFPKPFILNSHLKQHAAHDHEDKNSIPLQEHNQDDKKGLLDNKDQDREAIVQQVEYNQN